MKNSTLEAIARQSDIYAGSNAWATLNNIATSAGDNKEEANAKVLEFVVTLGFRCALEALSDKSENIEKDIRCRLSRLNEEYPFDVAEANHRVKRLLSRYVEVTAGYGTYAQTRAVIELLQNVESNHNPDVEECISKAWDCL